MRPCLGTESKKEYTVIGEAVYHATRLETLTRELNTPCLVCNRVRQLARRPWPFVDKGEHRLKGTEQPQRVSGLCADTW